MRVLTALPLLVMTACATGGGATGDGPPPGDPGVWPTGRYVASAELEFTAGAVRAGSSPRRLVQAEVYVGPEGIITLTTGEGSCQEHETRRSYVRDFSCGDASFRLTLEGRTIRGTVTAPVTYWTSGRSICRRWVTDPDGSRWCATYEETQDQLHTTRVSARLAVVATG